MSVVGMASVSSVDVEGRGQRHPLPPFRLHLCVLSNNTCPQKKKKKIPVLEGSASDPRMVSGAAAVTEARRLVTSSSSYQAYEHPSCLSPSPPQPALFRSLKFLSSCLMAACCGATCHIQRVHRPLCLGSDFLSNYALKSNA